MSYLVGGNKAKFAKALRMHIDIRSGPSEAFGPMGQFPLSGRQSAAGCLALNIDLEHYGVDLPEMPVNGMHYLGVDFRKAPVL